LVFLKINFIIYPFNLILDYKNILYLNIIDKKNRMIN
jgi:hypothetical protein